MHNTLKLFIVSALIFVSGCTAAKLDRIALNSSGDDSKLVPTTVFINRGSPVARFYVNRLEAVNNAIVKSGIFLDAGSHVRSPYVLDINLERDTHDNAADSAAQILSAGTLFLLPSKVHNINKLNVDFYAYGTLVKRYEYAEDYEEVLSIFNMKKQHEEGGNEFLSIENLVNTLLNDVQQDALIPRLKPSNVTHRPKTAI